MSSVTPKLAIYSRQSYASNVSCCFYRKKLFSAVHNFIHLNLSIALFLGYLVFGVGVELAAKNEVCLYSKEHANALNHSLCSICRLHVKL